MTKHTVLLGLSPGEATGTAADVTIEMRGREPLLLQPVKTLFLNPIEPHFSPEEEIAPTIVKLIDNAQHSLDIAAFAFTHPDIANAVIRAHQRGVKVRMVMDMVNEREKNSLAPELIKAGIPLRVRHKRGFQHSKYLIIDQSIVVTGSFNFTTSADERNSENIVVIRNAPNAERQFADDYQLLVAESVIE